MFRFAWIVASVLSALYVVSITWESPELVWPIVDISASILAIFVGVSVALFTVLAAKPAVSPRHYSDDDEKQRIEEAIGREDAILIGQQYALFVVYLFTIGLALLLKLLSSDQQVNPHELQLRLVSSAFGGFVTMSFMLSVFLPSIAAKLVLQRRHI